MLTDRGDAERQTVRIARHGSTRAGWWSTHSDNDHYSSKLAIICVRSGKCCLHSWFYISNGCAGMSETYRLDRVAELDSL